MNDYKPSRILDQVARDHIPDDANLLPQIMARMAKKEPRKMIAKMRLIWMIVLVGLGLTLATTVGYAIYRNFLDPGLQSVKEAGLGAQSQSTALPTLLAEVTPTVIPTLDIPQDESTQTIDGITVHIDWVDLSESGLALQFSVFGLNDSLKVGLPRVDFSDFAPLQYRGALFWLTEQEGTVTGRFVTYQLTRRQDLPNGVDLNITVPIEQDDGNTTLPWHNFLFQAQGVTITRSQLPYQQTYSVRASLTGLNLETMTVSPQQAVAYLCPSPGQSILGWSVEEATLQYLDRQGQPLGSPKQFERFTPHTTEDGRPCADLAFAISDQPVARMLRLSIQKLSVQSIGNPKFLAARWEYYADLPHPLTQPADSLSRSPLAAESIQNLTATLRWAFADASRVAFEVQFEGWQPGYRLDTITVTDGQGNNIGSAWPRQVKEDDPSHYLVHFTPDDPTFLQADEVTLGVDMPIYTQMDAIAPLGLFHFDLSLPVYPSVTLSPGLSVTANGIEMRLEQVEMTPSYTDLKLCYQKPTTEGNSDWMLPYLTTLVSGGYTVRPDTYSLLSDGQYGLEAQPGSSERCARIGVPLGHFNRNQPADFLLSIPRLELSIPEVIPDEDIRAANEKLGAEGIEMDYWVASLSSGGAAGPVIVRKPEGMSDAEVIDRFYAALGYYYEGPWEFRFAFQP